MLDHDSLPSWLGSLIFHLALILLLGLLYQGLPSEPGYEVTLNLQADPGLAEFEAGGGGGDVGELIDMALDGRAAEEIVVADAELAVESPTLSELVDAQLEGLLPATPKASDVAVDAHSLLAASGGTIVDDGAGGGSGEGAGGGQGKGHGTGAGDGEGEGHAYTSMFGLAGEGGNFVYAFDRSQSMNSVFTYMVDGARSLNITPLESAKKELIRSLGDLNDGCRFQVVFYNDIAVMFGGSPTMYTANYANKQLATSFVEGMKAEANTKHLVALEDALQCRPDMIFLLTDGEAKDDPSISEVRRLIRHCKKSKIKINVVHFCFDVRENCSLIQLAEGTGGQHRFITLRELAREKMHESRGTPTLRPVETLPSLQ